MAGRSQEARQLASLCERAARSGYPVLIEGERGAGHELAARHIHALGGGVRDFMRLPHTGAERGRAFRGLREDNGPSLYIPELSQLSNAEQMMLLEAAMERRSRAPSSCPARILAATAVDLLDEVREGRLRYDLYMRVSVMPVRLPPLRKRLDDAVALASAWFQQKKHNGREVKCKLTPDVLAALRSYSWPGNLAELEDCLQHLASLGRRRIALADLPPAMFKALTAPASGGRALAEEAAGAEPARRPSGQSRDIPAFTQDGEVRPVSAIEADLIRIAWARYHGKIADAARRLGLGRSTLYRKARSLGLVRERS